MSSYDWFRLWHGTPVDGKLSMIARQAGARRCEMTALWECLLDYASQQPERGSVAGIDLEVIAFQQEIDHDLVLALYAGLERKGVIADGKLVNWNERQPKREDGSAERAKAWREQKRTSAVSNESSPVETNAETDPRTQPNAPERNQPLSSLSISYSLSSSALDELNTENINTEREGEAVLDPPAREPEPQATADPPKKNISLVSSNGSSTTERKPVLKAVPKPTPEERREEIRVQILSPPELDWAADNVPGVAVGLEVDKFLDYLKSTGKTYRDYPAAFHNWLRRAKEYGSNGQTQNGSKSNAKARRATDPPGEDFWNSYELAPRV